uniref:Uncharacterized protein n=1 Tax=Pyxicephalus adspersus TaxID=30357 RepID=A0AAV3A3V3_PYXAD|nr:TPA: hypothetical protein GDO54_011606 [Pyxicephalus adspersus]
MGIFLHRYDSLTGVPSCQRALAFEKGSVLFNMGALYTQIGARQDRLSIEGVDTAIDAFQKAAGFQGSHFTRTQCLFLQVEEVYTLVHRTMMHPPVKDYVPFSWTTMARVKAEHFSALSHYHTGNALCDFTSKTQQKPEIKNPIFSKVKVTDIFHRLGPLSVFSAKHKWRPAQKIHLERDDGGFGFTLRGDSPVLIAGVVPGGCADRAGVKEGAYIVSVNSEDCRWSKHSEVVTLLKNTGDEGADIEIVTFQSADTQNTAVEKKSSMLTSGEILKRNKENGRKAPGVSKRCSTLLLWSRKSNPSKRSPNLSAVQLPFSAVQNSESMY